MSTTSPPLTERCYTCRFWDKRPKAYESDQDRGDCHRRAPVAVPSLHLEGHVTDYGVRLDSEGNGKLCVWPITGRNDWCGEREALS